MDAVMAGCVYLNPVYATPLKKIYNSQHPYLAQTVGEPYVCSFGQKVRINFSPARKVLRVRSLL